MRILNRILATLLVIIIWVDEGAQILFRGLWYIATGKGAPSPHETISAWLGMSQAAGKPIGTWLARRVDGIFGPGHCDGAMRKEKGVETPL